GRNRGAHSGAGANRRTDPGAARPQQIERELMDESKMAQVDEMLADCGEEWAALSWAGYLKEGRGFVCVNLTEATASEKSAGWRLVPIDYLAEKVFTEDAASIRLTQLLRPLLQKYDPATEFVLLVISGGEGNAARVNNLSVHPPEAYARCLERGVGFEKTEEWPTEIEV